MKNILFAFYVIISLFIALHLIENVIELNKKLESVNEEVNRCQWQEKLCKSMYRRSM